jgi:rhodanese-related sulfurtransferase
VPLDAADQENRMSARLAPSTEDAILEQAIRDAHFAGLPYAGSIAPADAWRLIQAERAVLVDVRSAEERKFVGYVPGSVHVPWATGTSLTRNPRFLRELESRVDKDAILLLICRSGKRSALAAEAATRIGFGSAFNVTEGFEGELDQQHRRGTLGGWRLRGLKWVQE